MIARIISGLVGIPLLVLLVFMRQGFPFILGVGVVTIVGVLEFYHAIRKTGARPQVWLGLTCAFLFLLAAQGLQSLERELPAVITLLVIMSLTVELCRRDRAPIKNLGATFLGAVYVGWLFSYLVALRSLTGNDVHVALINRDLPLGAWLVLYIIFTSWAADTGGFFVGRKFGQHKLAPVLSPGKSWEGLIAGMAASALMSALMGGLIGWPWWRTIPVGIGIALVSLVGDLAESAMKRDIGIKDFGTVLPGHGGILDRFDGLLFAAPLFYYFVVAFPMP